MSTCRSCGAEILWARTPSGKAMPLDAVPNLAGEAILVNDIVQVSRALADAAIDAGRADDVYIVHWATCPNAKAHRKPPPPRGGGPARPI